jgi:hypothetical protein
MRTALILIFVALLAGCSSLDFPRPFGGGRSGSGTSKTFGAPIARVKPAFVSTLAQMGMTISSVETRGKREVIKARKAGSQVVLEIERLGSNATRVRVDATGQVAEAQIIRQSEKNLGGV